MTWEALLVISGVVSTLIKTPEAIIHTIRLMTASSSIFNGNPIIIFKRIGESFSTIAIIEDLSQSHYLGLIQDAARAVSCWRNLKTIDVKGQINSWVFYYFLYSPVSLVEVSRTDERIRIDVEGKTNILDL
jgi:hypothetical protein